MMTTIDNQRGARGFWVVVGVLALFSLYIWPWVGSLLFGILFGSWSWLTHGHHVFFWTFFGFFVGFWIGVSFGARSLFRRLVKIR